MRKTRWIALLLAVVMVMSLCACGGFEAASIGGKPANGKVVLQFWGWGDDEIGRAHV